MTTVEQDWTNESWQSVFFICPFTKYSFETRLCKKLAQNRQNCVASSHKLWNNYFIHNLIPKKIIFFLLWTKLILIETSLLEIEIDIDVNFGRVHMEYLCLRPQGRSRGGEKSVREQRGTEIEISFQFNNILYCKRLFVKHWTLNSKINQKQLKTNGISPELISIRRPWWRKNIIFKMFSYPFEWHRWFYARLKLFICISLLMYHACVIFTLLLHMPSSCRTFRFDSIQPSVLCVCS